MKVAFHQVPGVKRSRKAVNTKAYEEWKASIIVARQALKSSASGPLPPKNSYVAFCIQQSSGTSVFLVSV